MNIQFLDLKRQQIDLLEPVHRVLNRGWFILGPEVETFEAAFADYCGTTECIGTGNGTDALELTLRGLGVGPGDEVATVANAGMYATTAIRAIGAVPLFVDIDPDNLLISPAALSAILQPTTRAVIATHLYGLIAPMTAILKITQAYGIPVIEDCAQAHGAIRDGRMAGNWGVAGCFSFYPTKNLGAAGDAGAIVTSDRGLASRLRALRQYGWTTRFHSSFEGGRNSRLDEIQAAILSAKLPFLNSWNERRRLLARRYSEAFTASGVLPHVADPQEDYVAHLYVVRSLFRDRLQLMLAQRGIQTNIHYPTPDHMQPSQRQMPFRRAGLEHTEDAAAQILTLPCYPELTDEEVQTVIRSFWEIHDELR